MTASEQNFLIEQYRALRQEINDTIAEIRSLQRYALVGVALVWAWVATNSSVAPNWAAFCPLAFLALGMFHTSRLLREMGDQGTFIAGVIEPALLGSSTRTAAFTPATWLESGTQGWENWIRQYTADQRKGFRGESAKRHDPSTFFAPIWLEWIVLAVAVVAVGCWQNKVHSRPHDAAVTTSCFVKAEGVVCPYSK